jgi:hypothetical protein
MLALLGWLNRPVDDVENFLKKVVDEIKKTVDNLASLLLTTICWWQAQEAVCKDGGMRCSLKIYSR